MSDSLFDKHSDAKCVKELWDILQLKYIVEDDSRKKFMVSDLYNYKIVYSIYVMEKYNELLCILGQFKLHKMNMF